MVNNGILKIPKDRLLTVEILQCNRCKVNYPPTKDDISVRNPNRYYSTCRTCRDYIKMKVQECKKRKELIS